MIAHIRCQTDTRTNAKFALEWRHNERDGVSNHRRLDCLLNPLFRRRSEKTSNLRVTGLREENLVQRVGLSSQGLILIHTL